MRIFDRRALRRTTWRHWLVAVMLAIVGLIAGEYPWLTSVRHVAYAILQKAIQRPDADIVVVLIGDDEYNGPRLQNRVPLRRDYLADLITKIRAGNPRA
ncbi:MAG TPA: CHASE2 domain-containing protein, partial [Thermoanaerobaculia bacterium]|nr:CHASE2 domain-containing protein [Thermoanaerobaculia bacterium]